MHVCMYACMSPQVGIASPPEYFLHKKAHNRGTKLSSQRRCIPVGRRLQHCQHALLYAGSWNVCSLVEASGDRRICHACSTTHDGPGVERKLDLLVNKLKHYSISIAGIQETKWFGSDIWPLVNGPFYIQVMSCRLTVILILDEMKLEFCWMVGLLRRGELLERHGRLCHLGLCVPD